MLEVAPHRLVIEDLSELPDPRPTQRLYIDVETTSFDETKPAFHPYLGDRICGWAFTWDNHPDAYYIPVRHSAPGSKNLDIGGYMNEWVSKTEAWVNHNVKFDVHFAVQDGVNPPSRMVDTVVLAQLLESDRLNHQLKPLCRQWLGWDMEEEGEVDDYLSGLLPGNRKCKDYGRLPVDLCGKYACMDVLGNRALYEKMIARLPSEQRNLWEQEVALTPVLWDMEHIGLLIDRPKTLRMKRETLTNMILLADRVHELTGLELIDSNDATHELLIGHLGLPVLAKTETGGASFDKEAMVLYRGLPEVVTDAKTKEIVEAILQFRTLGRLKGLFLDPFIEKADDNHMLHPSYRQLVRTGRMACYDPNAQQFNEAAAELIIPRPGYTFCCWDGKQIEFRVIAHFIRNERVLQAYADNEEVDFHDWVRDVVAELVTGFTRRPAKTINFATAFGAGKNRIMHTLAAEDDVMSAVYEEDMTAVQYESACRRYASSIYETYHSTLPELKRTAEKARNITVRRGYIRNPYGRRRHLPRRGAHKAFNTLVQGTAMDIIKEKMVEVNPWVKSMGARIAANKHDELLFEVPSDAVEEFQLGIGQRLENRNLLRVPVLWDGHHGRTWAEAK